MTLPAIRPGEVLAELYLKPLDLSAGALAKKLNLPRTRIERLIKGQTGMSPDTALRLARFFGTSAQYWMNLQTNYELKVAAEEQGAEIQSIEPLEAA